MDGSFDDNSHGARPHNPWLLVDGADDISLAMPGPDAFAHTNWDEWMRWDPAAVLASPKSHHDMPPGTVGTPAAGPGRFPLSNNTSSSTPAQAATSFVYNTPLEDKSPFAYGGMVPTTVSDTSSTNTALPTSAGSQYHHGFFSPPPLEQHHESATMPHAPLSTPSLHHSPESSTDVKTTPSSQSSPTSHSPPHTGDSHSKKRKSSGAALSEEKVDKEERAPPPKKTAHNMIEKRYRNNLNEKIRELQMAVPSLRAMTKANGHSHEEDDAEDLEGLTPAHKLNKATVLSKATEYIHHLEKRVKRSQDELNNLKSRLDTMEKYSMAGVMPVAMTSTAATPSCVVQEDPFASVAPGAPSATTTAPQGMIPVPQSMVNLHRPVYYNHRPDLNGGPMFSPSSGGAVRPALTHDEAQAMAAHMASHRPLHTHPMVNHHGRGNGLISKLMVGSLAGLMLLEGFHEHEQSSETPAGRGLFAAPFQLLLRLGPKLPREIAMHNASVFQRVMLLLKSFSLVAAFVWLLMPLLTFNARPKRKPTPLLRLAPAPSLASPIEVRRTAWLTAIQTVWVPQHNFILELAALGLKMLKLSTRKLIGWQGYALLTGITKEQEAARVKAWDIALNAQLTGGDADIGVSRLLLTLLASGTLPDTPARLMLKALHIRVLFCEDANAGRWSWLGSLLEPVWLKLARRYWNAAQEEHRLASFDKQGISGHDELPKHLVALLNLECDDVLIKGIVQRAYNLAWNRPSAANAQHDEAMDSIVEDFAISSPLDALAAWWSTNILSNALALYLDSVAFPDEASDDNLIWMDMLQHAIETAPPLTGAWTRALAAQAVLVDSSRGKNITRALDALPSRPALGNISKSSSSSPRAVLMNVIDQAPAGADVRGALSVAKCLALADRDSPMATAEAQASAIHFINHFSLPECGMSSLSMVAAYKLVDSFANDDELFAKSKCGLERMTMAIRMWIGGEGGRSCGVAQETRGRITGRCLAISRRLVGIFEDKDIEIDAGYHTQSDSDSAFT